MTKRASLVLGGLMLIAEAHPTAAGDRVDVTVFGGASFLEVPAERIYYLCAPEAMPRGCDRAGLPGIGPGFLQGAAVAYRVASRTALEASFGLAPFRDQDGPGPATYDADLSVRHELGRSDTRPYVFFGAGLVVYGNTGEHMSDLSNDLSWHVGVGLSLKLAERVRLRVDAADHLIPNQAVTDETEHDVRVRLGVTLTP